MTRLLGYARTDLLELWRYPAFVAPSIAYPLLLFCFFGLPLSSGADGAVAVMLSFSAFAILGVVLFSFGVGFASRRDSGWESYTRTLPHSVSARFASRVVVAVPFALAAAAPVLVIATVATPADVASQRWLPILLAMTLGAIPFSVLGIAIGYCVSARAAVPVTNLLFLPLAYAGGLLQPGHALPGVVERISPLLPTRMWSDWLLAAAFAGPIPLRAVAGLTGYAVAFAVAGLLAFQRNEEHLYA